MRTRNGFLVRKTQRTGLIINEKETSYVGAEKTF